LLTARLRDLTARRTFAERLIDCEEDRVLRRCWSACCGRSIT